MIQKGSKVQNKDYEAMQISWLRQSPAAAGYLSLSCRNIVSLAQALDDLLCLWDSFAVLWLEIHLLQGEGGLFSISKKEFELRYPVSWADTKKTPGSCIKYDNNFFASDCARRKPCSFHLHPHRIPGDTWPKGLNIINLHKESFTQALHGRAKGIGWGKSCGRAKGIG